MRNSYHLDAELIVIKTRIQEPEAAIQAPEIGKIDHLKSQASSNEKPIDPAFMTYLATHTNCSNEYAEMARRDLNTLIEKFNVILQQ